MQEIRFSNPAKKEVETLNPEITPERKIESKTSNSNFFKTFLILVLMVLVVSAAIFGKDLAYTFWSNEKNEWSAVFLSNGQVYFGKIESNNKREMVLKNVYYLQADESLSGQSIDNLSQSRFKLVKLGSELHGPKDVLIINKSSVVFYEYLREDSQVVQSINKS